MSLTVTLKASGELNLSTTASAKSGDLSPITFAAGCHVVVLLTSTKASSAASALTCTSSGLTFTKQLNPHQLSVDKADAALLTAPHSAGGSTTINISSGGLSCYGLMYAVYEVTGHDPATPFGATASVADNTTDGAKTITLSGAPKTTSTVIAGIYGDANAGTNSVDVGSGWTEDGEVDSSASNFGVMQFQRRASSTSTSVDWADVAPAGAPAVFSVAAVAIEINVLSDQPTFAHWRQRPPGHLSPAAFPSFSLHGDTGTSADASVSGTDTGSGADTATYTAALTGTDTGTGADTGSLAAALAGADTGSGADTSTLAAGIAGADTGAGVDTSSLTTATTASDTGTGANSGSLAAALTASDTGTGADTGSLVVSITASDTGTGVDNATVDTATQVSGTDTGSGSESGSLSAATTAADTGTGADTASLSASLTASDAAAGTDTGSLAAALTAADTASGTDTASVVILQAVSGADTGAGTASGSLSAGVTASDTASAVDTAFVTVTLTVLETAAATEATTLLAATLATDTATGAEATQLVDLSAYRDITLTTAGVNPSRGSGAVSPGGSGSVSASPRSGRVIQPRWREGP